MKSNDWDCLQNTHVIKAAPLLEVFAEYVLCELTAASSESEGSTNQQFSNHATVIDIGSDLSCNAREVSAQKT